MSFKKKGLLISMVLSSSVLFSSFSSFAIDATYKVKSGDTLRKISTKYHMTWKHLAKLNNIKSPYLIFPNQILKLQENTQVPTSDPVCKPELKKQEITQKDLNEQLVMAEFWMQNSAEYKALCYQAYNTAKVIVDQNVASFKKGDKPLALITDCDETVMENSIYDAGFIDHNDSHNDDNWNKWVDAAEGKAMPGAKKFLDYAHSKGVEIFYVTGRDEKNSLDGTMKNLKKIGFPCVDKYHMRLKTDTGNKEPRMKELEKKYNVIIYMGDDEGDFPVGSYNQDMKTRNSLADKHKNEFGSKFIVLPNPSYGHWESSLAKNYWKLTPEQKNALRKQLIKTWRCDNK
ncbi:5'-nucleotidase, lipoprotein e(P4) family [Clostridium botulinum]|uniref:5'-nucleotidase, lipoprotein e(P4) family n=1 Tax=Clostridium botulinum TaxID=1491 RepID=UPI00052CF24B|nr:5'-nucleotidase, lipoprotein e(P4) family [Clostridium botulinum]KGM93666.1 5'-nucleotidase [Clostridium botulinum D str. CCUG 7971]KOC47808.1 5'-nucleotidase [Clostridium botulinum]NFO97690.1 5'-nucleotidase, lipoprotein e(P4) family [Clostridium botulinum]OOV51989.1 5'-nucleotidase, lipoprotein e(P4) family [Clostridium botulinum D/C]OOV53214.1 5'-nucleotidase, lipoprotein e(P4) family [Clostridium botulinum D/C]